MQNKHQNFFLSCWCPNVRGGGGGQAGWDKIPSLPKKIIGRLPLRRYVSDAEKEWWGLVQNEALRFVLWLDIMEEKIMCGFSYLNYRIYPLLFFSILLMLNGRGPWIIINLCNQCHGFDHLTFFQIAFLIFPEDTFSWNKMILDYNFSSVLNGIMK